MVPITIVRGIGIALVALTQRAAGSDLEYYWFAIVFAHYVLAVVYSRRQINRLAHTPSVWGIAALALAVGVLTGITHIPNTGLYFGLHFVLSEMYLLPCDRDQLPRANWILACRFAMNSALYFFCFRVEPVLHSWPRLAFALLYAGAAIGFAAALYASRRDLSSRQILDFLGMEALAVLIFYHSAHSAVGSKLLVLYHCWTWVPIPLPKLFARGARPVFNYALTTVGITAFFFALTPAGGSLFAIPYSALFSQIVFWAYLHPALTFILSDRNPRAVMQLFTAPAKETLRAQKAA